MLYMYSLLLMLYMYSLLLLLYMYCLLLMRSHGQARWARLGWSKGNGQVEATVRAAGAHLSTYWDLVCLCLT
jgi:hypothetical protein